MTMFDKEKLPFGIIYCCAINMFNGLVFLAVGGFFLITSSIAIIGTLLGEGRNSSSQDVYGSLGFIVFSFVILIPGLLLLKLNKGLKALSQTARFWQIVFSCFGLAQFPIGTILHGICLYFMIADTNTKEAFA